MVAVSKKLKILEDKKNKIRDQAKALKERERLSFRKQQLEIGRLAMKAKISDLDNDSLFGAFLEISEKAKDEENQMKWKKICTTYQETNEKNGQALTIYFKSPPSAEVKDRLKKLKFRWNSFRGEYYGFGDKKVISDQFKSPECKIESI